MNTRTPQPHRPPQRIQQPSQAQQHPPQPQLIQPRPPALRPAPPQQQDAAQATTHILPRAPSLGQGQGLLRLLQFSSFLSSESKTKLQLAWWNDLIREYFTPKAYMKLTLWKDNQRKEAKPFEIGVPILPRFFLVTTQSGVKSMSLSLDGARERYITTGHCIVECVSAVWTYKYNNGYTVTLRGALSAHVIITATSAPGAASQTSGQPNPPYSFKFDEFTFDANYHDKFIALDAIVGTRIQEPPKPPRSPWIRDAPSPSVNGSSTDPFANASEEDKRWEEPRVVIERCSIPGEPVNAFGIPQATMRCLELAESVGSMAELITYSTDTQLGPLEALKSLASRVRQEQGSLPDGPPNAAAPATATGIAAAGGAGGVVNGYPGGPHALPHPPSGPGAPFNPTTLYPGAPGQPAQPVGSGGGRQTPQHGTPQGAHASISTSNTTVNSPQTRPGSAINSPHKIHKNVQLQPGMGGPHMGGQMSQPGMGPGSQLHSPVTPAMQQQHLHNLGSMGGMMGGPMGSMGGLGAPMGGLAGPPMGSMNMGGAMSGMGNGTPTMAPRVTSGPPQGASPGMVAASPSLAAGRTGGPDQPGGKPSARKRARTGARNG
ncbi:hypothetical protein Agabi119p4_4812 [Agaricus bisporus var. burnettii]|uniref:LIM interaction domain-containing protein n=1 Tax=Agaricus bisporus var. burnettii TaxID=192524 RepID=A0A8H7F3Z7_AGABI|nr:hypothetical protein Agabi119p4_4812 [Agaricus bisporus var. burnettii]